MNRHTKNKINEANQDVNNLNGKIKSFQANKGASIGAFVQKRNRRFKESRLVRK